MQLSAQKTNQALSDILATNGELLGRFDAHFDAPTGTAQQGNQDGTVGEQLRHRHVGVNPVGGLYDDRLIGSSAED